MSNYTIRVILDGQDNASDDFARVNQSMDQLKRKNDEVAQSTGTLGQKFKSFNQDLKGVETAILGMGTAFAGLQVAKFVNDMYQAGEEARRVGNAFQSTAGSAAESVAVLGRLTDTIKHIDDTTLQRTFTDFRDVLKLSNDEASGLIETVTKLNRYGEDAGTFFENTLSALKNQRTNLLDNLGINVGEFREIRDQLTDAGVSAADAFNEAFRITAESAAQEFGAVAEQNITALDRLATRWENFVSTSQVTLAGLVAFGSEFVENGFNAEGAYSRVFNAPTQEEIARGNRTMETLPADVVIQIASDPRFLAAIQVATEHAFDPALVGGAARDQVDLINEYASGYYNSFQMPDMMQYGSDQAFSITGARSDFWRSATPMLRDGRRLADSVIGIVADALEANSFNATQLASAQGLAGRAQGVIGGIGEQLYGAGNGYMAFDPITGSILPFDTSGLRQIAGQRTVSDVRYDRIMEYGGQLQGLRSDAIGAYYGAIERGEPQEIIDSYAETVSAVDAATAAFNALLPNITSVTGALQQLSLSDIFTTDATTLQQEVFDVLTAGLPDDVRARQQALFDEEHQPRKTVDDIFRLDAPRIYESILGSSGNIAADEYMDRVRQTLMEIEAQGLAGQRAEDYFYQGTGYKLSGGGGSGMGSLGSYNSLWNYAMGEGYGREGLDRIIAMNQAANPDFNVGRLGADTQFIDPFKSGGKIIVVKPDSLSAQANQTALDTTARTSQTGGFDYEAWRAMQWLQDPYSGSYLPTRDLGNKAWASGGNPMDIYQTMSFLRGVGDRGNKGWAQSGTGMSIGDKSSAYFDKSGMSLDTSSMGLGDYVSGILDTLVTDAQTAGEDAGSAIATGIGAGAAEAAGAVDTISAALAGLQGTYSVVVSVKYEVDPASDPGARAAAERQQRDYDRMHNTAAQNDVRV